METNLNQVVGMNKYCGPAVLSILTGRSTDECANVIGSITGKYNVEGVKLNDLMKAASILGFDNEVVEPWGNLHASLTMLSLKGDGKYIVEVPRHVVTIEVKDKKIFFCDNHTKQPMPAAGSARLTQNVTAIRKVMKRREPKLVDSYIKARKHLQYQGKTKIELHKYYVHDMPEHDKTVQVASFYLDDKELKAFIEELTRE